MPEESSPLTYNSEFVHITLAFLYGTLSHICGSVRPSSSKLSNAMPIRVVTYSWRNFLDYINKVFKWRTSIPVNGDVVGHMVNHFYWKLVAFPYHGTRTRKLPIYRNDTLAWHKRATFCNLTYKNESDISFILFNDFKVVDGNGIHTSNL